MSYFIEHDHYGDVWLWRGKPGCARPVAVISQDDLRDDPDVWDALVRFARGADHLPQRMADHLGIGDR